jgi:hypothetical protein
VAVVERQEKVWIEVCLVTVDGSYKTQWRWKERETVRGLFWC